MVIKITKKIITINIPNVYKTILDRLVDKGIIPSICEMSRVAIKEFLDEELLYSNSLKNFRIDENKRPVIEQIIGTQKKYIKPEKIYCVFKYGMNKNYLISFLKQANGKWLYKDDLCRLMDCGQALINDIFNDIDNVHPNLIIKGGTKREMIDKHYRQYKLNENKFNEIMEGKEIL